MARRVYSIDDKVLRHAFAVARASGELRPTFRVGPYSFSQWQEGLGISVAYHAPDAEAYLGIIERGRLRPSPMIFQRDIKKVQLIVEHPKKAAIAAAQVDEPPRCACCCRLLGRLDKQYGIGAKCREKWGW